MNTEINTELKVKDKVTIRDGSYAMRVDSYETYTSIGLCKDTFEVVQTNVNHGFIRSKGSPKKAIHDIVIKNTVTDTLYLHSSPMVNKLIAPVIDFTKFTFAFFAPYGGVLATHKSNGNFVVIAGSGWVAIQKSAITLRKSPLYPWVNGKCPVPGNVEVNITLRCGDKQTRRADALNWGRTSGGSRDIIAFQITGNICE